MSEAKPKKPYRKKHLFPRTLEQTLKEAMQPMMNQQGKLYTALLRDWERIVGAESAAISRPQRLQFLAQSAQGATLHLNVRPAAAPELTYMQEQILEQCARYFGYRAITRLVLHPLHGSFAETATPVAPAPNPPLSVPSTMPLPDTVMPEMREVLSRIGAHVGSGVVKKDERG